MAVLAARPDADASARLAMAFEGTERLRRYPRGSLVFADGDEAHEVLLIVTGSVKVLAATPDGKQVVIDVLDPGSLLGELSAIDGTVRSATAVALTAVEACVLPSDEFRARLRREPALTTALLDVTAARLRVATRRQLELGAADATGRVCRRLIDLADRYGSPGAAGELTIGAPLTQLDVAEWAGLSREAVVKALRTLRTLGWIRIAGREIVVLDRCALAERANG